MRGVFTRDCLQLGYEDAGEGRAVIFQHGLGGDARQTAEVFPAAAGLRRVTLECRGQGESEIGPIAELSIPTFSADVAALADRLQLGRCIVGGISLGAAIAMRLAVQRPDLVGTLILARPAWLFDAAPENMQSYALAGRLLAEHAPNVSRESFRRSAIAQRLAREAPDNLSSLLGFFDRPDAGTFGAVLTAIAADGPGVTLAEAERIAVPTLVIGHGEDLAHPLSCAERLASVIPNAKLARITSKVVDRTRYVAEFRAAMAAFVSDCAIFK